MNADFLFLNMITTSALKIHFHMYENVLLAYSHGYDPRISIWAFNLHHKLLSGISGARIEKIIRLSCSNTIQRTP